MAVFFPATFQLHLEQPAVLLLVTDLKWNATFQLHLEQPAVLLLVTDRKRNEAQSARAESVHKGANQRSKDVTQAYLSTRTVYQYKIQGFFSIILGRYGHIGKWIEENIIFMRFCCCFKLSEKIEKLSNEQPTHAITKCTRTGLVQ